MQENACYSVITPEGCAAILWREGGPERVADAAAALKLSAPDLLRLWVADEVVPEPPGGAHQDPPRAARELGRSIERHLVRLSRLSPIRVRREREKKFAAMGSAFVSARRVENQRPLG
jgi:acetyl-CoA carboxylase carboxyl transferase subunit alpha